MDAAMLATVLRLLGQAREQLRLCQSSLARAQASVYLLEQLAGELERAVAEKAVR